MFNVLQLVFLNLDEPYGGVTNIGSYERTSGLDDPSGDVMGGFGLVANFVGFFFGGFLFTIPSLPLYMTVIITPIYLLLLIAFWYLVIDFIKDTTILGSHL